MKIHSRPLDKADFKAMRALLLRDGSNEWNYITSESINSQLQLIDEKKALAVLAEDNEIVGFAILIFREACPSMLRQYCDISSTAYINDVVVSLNQSGRGVGSKLLLEAIDLAQRENCNKVYIERHEENRASAGMMRKAGFEIVETFYDPEKRTAGSRKTSVLSVCL